jgi:hypothetical protein
MKGIDRYFTILDWTMAVALYQHMRCFRTPQALPSPTIFNYNTYFGTSDLSAFPFYILTYPLSSSDTRESKGNRRADRMATPVLEGYLKKVRTHLVTHSQTETSQMKHLHLSWFSNILSNLT